MKSITPNELAARLLLPNPPLLLDVRESEEHIFCSIAGSRLLPLSELAARANELDDWSGATVVVYCHHGVRSGRAIGFLQALGHKDLINLSGGIDQWSEEVDPTVARY